MKNMRLLGLRRIAAGFLLAAMLIAGFLALVVTAREVSHRCTGHDCPACVFFAVFESNLESFGTGVPAATALGLPLPTQFAILPPNAPSLPRPSQVALKIRLNL